MNDRRSYIKQMLAMGAAAGSCWSWPGQLASAMNRSGSPRRLIILWMPGGPSQIDTFDLKPGHVNGGPIQEIPTRVPGTRISEHLPGLAELIDRLAIVRSMQTTEGDHSRGTYLVRTGQRPGAPISYPSLPAALGKELSEHRPELPGYVNIASSSQINPQAFTAGFLGASREPLTVAASPEPMPTNPEAQSDQAELERPVELKVENLLPPGDLDQRRIARRHQFWNLLQQSYTGTSVAGPAAVHDTVYRRAMKLAQSDLVKAFDLERESDAMREAYGFEAFGQGCLLARRLLEAGVSVVEVALSDGPGGLPWDSHTDNFATVRRLSGILDRGWSQLMRDLQSRGLLESTTIAWMGEFGRTPVINDNGGRDHFPNAWSCVLAGAGVVGGAVFGKTSDDGMEVIERPVTAPDFLATLTRAVGVNPELENLAEDRRPIKIAEGQPIAELLA